MASLITDTTALANLIEAAYDREVQLAQHSEPFFRQAITTRRAAHQAMPGQPVVFSIGSDLPPATTPLVENQDVDAVQLAAPTRVQVNLAEYGNAAITTIKLDNLAFVSVDTEKVRQISYNMADSIDLIVRGVLDSTTNKVWVNGGSLTTTGSDNGVTATDKISSGLIRAIVTRFRTDSVPSPRGTTYPVYIHPDVSADLQAEVGPGGWRTPKEYVNAQELYVGEVGTYLGATFIETPRCNQVNNASSVAVYSTYFMGADAVAEASAIEPHVVVGPQTDKLRRFFTLGWYALMGWGLFRPANLWVAHTTSAAAL